MLKMTKIETWQNEDTHKWHCKIEVRVPHPHPTEKACLRSDPSEDNIVIEREATGEGLAINFALIELNAQLLSEIL